MEAFKLVPSFQKIGRRILPPEAAEILITFGDFSYYTSHKILSALVTIFLKYFHAHLSLARIIKLTQSEIAEKCRRNFLII